MSSTSDRVGESIGSPDNEVLEMLLQPSRGAWTSLFHYGLHGGDAAGLLNVLHGRGGLGQVQHLHLMYSTSLGHVGDDVGNRMGVLSIALLSQRRSSRVSRILNGHCLPTIEFLWSVGAAAEALVGTRGFPKRPPHVSMPSSFDSTTEKD
ncbi:hypothetical protein Patl1_36910 [Pistacia atlantica]|nr:hypothetical protein Patl1_36910 [Pistacia atlantica]